MWRSAVPTVLTIALISAGSVVRAATATAASTRAEPPPDLGARVPPAELLVPPHLPVPTDRASARRLADAVVQHAPLTSGDVEWAESLANRYESEPALQALRECVLAEAAAQATHDRRFVEALAYLRRAASLYPKHRGPRIHLIDVLLKTSDWVEAESAARQSLLLDADDVEAAVGLAYALMRQDRNDEAVRVLEDLLSRHDDAVARQLLARIRRILEQEKSLAEERESHFTLRYDGQVNDAVGHRVLEMLEGDYASLAAQLGHQPREAVPVILLANEEYYRVAPEWSGGEFDVVDGRIRIPIRGLTEDRVPRLGPTLVHELTHVFVASASGNLAPRELQEGLAQYMEGRRLAQLPRIADGKHADVARSYRDALSFVEFLINRGGVGGLSFAVRETGDTGELDKGFLAAYAQDYAASRAAWQSSLASQP
jgi:tetratricopeptide (TPR) repeat protein